MIFLMNSTMGVLGCLVAVMVRTKAAVRGRDTNTERGTGRKTDRRTGAVYKYEACRRAGAGYKYEALNRP